ncbi:MAG: class I SAM-dependent methyltransferase [Magnetococcales bacterium]|nr:class I SAM-dependent methyltransferase [Magnetococcales bacterium]
MTSPKIYNQNYYENMRGGEQTDPGEGKDLYDLFLDLMPQGETRQLMCLDVGCGRGNLLLKLFQNGYTNCFGFDFSPTAVNVSRNLLAKSLNVDVVDRVIEGNISNANLYKNNSFDIIFMTDIVEHLPHDVLHDGLRNIGRWLRQDGKVIIHTFPTLGLHRMFLIFLTLTGKWSELNKNSKIHCNVQTCHSLSEVISSSSLICEKIWLQNDMLLTSSAYKQMQNGLLKKCVRFFLHDMMKISSIDRMFNLIGLAEYANPSLYCICRKPS